MNNTYPNYPQHLHYVQPDQIPDGEHSVDSLRARNEAQAKQSASEAKASWSSDWSESADTLKSVRNEGVHDTIMNEDGLPEDCK